MNTETIFYDGKDGKSVFRTKVDLHKGDDNCLQSFRVTMWIEPSNVYFLMMNLRSRYE